MPPCQEEGVLHRILGAIGVAQDEVGDAEQPRMRCLHELGVGIDVSAHRPFDQRSLHGRHRFGAKHISALSHTRSRRMPEPAVPAGLGRGWSRLNIGRLAIGL